MIEYSAVAEKQYNKPPLKLEVKFKAVTYANYRFYISDMVFDQAMTEALAIETKSMKILHLMKMAHYAVFIPENRLEKCRMLLVDLLDSALLKQ